MRSLLQLKQDFLDLKITPTNWLGDSPSRFDTYKQLSSQVDSIVEFGVYTGLSTCAWLSGLPKKLRSYDITDKHLSVLDDLKACAKATGTDFEFAIADSLQIDIEPCDLLFIDTVHKFDHCLAELNRHGNKASKYIVLHDPTEWPGVFSAVVEFLKSNHNWHIVQHCNKNSGLLVLERYSD